MKRVNINQKKNKKYMSCVTKFSICYWITRQLSKTIQTPNTECETESKSSTHY